MEIIDSEEGNKISPLAISYMKSAGIWMKFIAIVFFVLSLILVVATVGLFFKSVLIGFIYAVLTGLLIYTSVLLVGMGGNLSSYTSSPNSISIDGFFRKTKNYFMTWGIIIALYIVVVILIFITGAAMGMGAMQEFFQGLN